MRRISIRKPGRALALCFIFIAGLVLSSCAKRQAGPRERPLIGFSMDSFVVERWTRDRDIFMATAASIGADVILQVGEQSAELQERQVEYLIGQNVDVLVIIPNDADRLTKLAVQARKKGIPVICYDRLIRNAGTDLLVSFDSYRVGTLQAQALLRFAPRGDIAIINGASTDNNALLYHRGYMDVLSPAIQRGDIRLIWDEWDQSWRSEWASESMRSILSRAQRPAGIIAANDMLAEAAIRVLSEHRLAGKIPVMGHDAELSACQRIAAGTQSMTVYKPLRELATKAAQFAVALARGEAPSANDSIDDGSFMVPFWRIDPIPVYAETMEETVVKDGFHSREDIWQARAMEGPQ